MKHIVLFFITLITFSCSTSKKTIIDNRNLIGEISILDLKNGNHSEWYNKNYNIYNLKNKYIEQLNKIDRDYNISIYLGTWCQDSKLQVPRFIKILDSINFDHKKLKLFGLNKAKTSPNKIELDKNIIYVPTIIIYRNKKEVNRIIEMPLNSLEEDLLNILQKNTYKNIYAD